MMESRPKFIQGIFTFTGAGYDHPVLLADTTIASDRRGQPIYMRAGNSSDELVSLTLSCNDTAIRLFPIGAKSATHVQLAVVEDIEPDSKLAISVTGPAGTSGVIVLDFGLVEI